MEQHPVPQNVTTFQFRLIGDMTLKQFGYMAAGGILGYIAFKLPLPLFLNWPLAITIALTGFGFAFVPIEERPMDVWVLSFFKSIYSPTEYVWSKNQQQGSQPTKTQAPQAQGVTIPAATPVVPQQPDTTNSKGSLVQNLFSPQQGASVLSVKAQKGPFDWLFQMLNPKPQKAPVPSQAAFPSTIHPKMDMSPPPAVQVREQKSKDEEAVLQKQSTTKPKVDPHVNTLQKQLDDLVAERNKMEAEIAKLKLQKEPSVPKKPQGTYVATPASQKGPSVRIITPDRAVYAGLPRLTSFPNVVTGIVKDGDQNLLPGVLVTVKDKDGVPVRALKTNRLGQFAASTPIANGTYTVEVEDPRTRFTFDRAQITLNGSIVPALEIFAKTQKEITRAKLEKELFGNKN